MKKALFIGAILAATSYSGVAMADEANWAGPYVGVQLNLSRLQDKHTDLDDWYYNMVNATFEDSGVMAGVKAGYDYVSGPMIVGVLAEASFGKLDTYQEVMPSDPSYEIGSKIKMLGSVRAKLGVTSGKLAAFVTGGWAFSDAKHNYLETDSDAEAYYKAHGDRSGYVLGVGAAYAIDAHSSVGLDVSRYQFGSKTHELLGTGDGGSVLNEPWDYFFRQQDRVDTVAVGYNYRF